MGNKDSFGGPRHISMHIALQNAPTELHIEGAPNLSKSKSFRTNIIAGRIRRNMRHCNIGFFFLRNKPSAVEGKYLLKVDGEDRTNHIAFLPALNKELTEKLLPNLNNLVSDGPRGV